LYQQITQNKEMCVRILKNHNLLSNEKTSTKIKNQTIFGGE